MNKLRPTIKLALFISVASLFFAACSDDDDKSIPVPEPSRMITGIKVHKISDVITYQGMISLTYDNNKRLTRIYSSSPLAAVLYGKFSFGRNKHLVGKRQKLCMQILQPGKSGNLFL